MSGSGSSLNYTPGQSEAFDKGYNEGYEEASKHYESCVGTNRTDLHIRATALKHAVDVAMSEINKGSVPTNGNDWADLVLMDAQKYERFLKGDPNPIDNVDDQGNDKPSPLDDLEPLPEEECENK